MIRPLKSIFFALRHKAIQKKQPLIRHIEKEEQIVLSTRAHIMNIARASSLFKLHYKTMSHKQRKFYLAKNNITAEKIKCELMSYFPVSNRNILSYLDGPKDKICVEISVPYFYEDRMMGITTRAFPTAGYDMVSPSIIIPEATTKSRIIHLENDTTLKAITKFLNAENRIISLIYAATKQTKHASETMWYSFGKELKDTVDRQLAKIEDANAMTIHIQLENKILIFAIKTIVEKPNVTI